MSADAARVWRARDRRTRAHAGHCALPEHQLRSGSLPPSPPRAFSQNRFSLQCLDICNRSSIGASRDYVRHTPHVSRPLLLLLAGRIWLLIAGSFLVQKDDAAALHERHSSGDPHGQPDRGRLVPEDAGVLVVFILIGGFSLSF